MWSVNGLQDSTLVRWSEHALGIELRVLASSPARPALPAIASALEAAAAADLRVLVVERPHVDDDAKEIVARVQARCQSLKRLEWGAEGIEISEMDPGQLLAGTLRPTQPSATGAFDIGGAKLPHLEELSVNRVGALSLANAAVPELRRLSIELRLPTKAAPFNVATALRTPLPMLAELRLNGRRDGSTWASSAATMFDDPVRVLALPLPQLRALWFSAPFDEDARLALFASPLLAQLRTLWWGAVMYEGDERERGVTAPGVATELSFRQRDQLVGKSWWLGIHGARTGIAKGARVEHARFGRGIVIESAKVSPEAQVLIEFDDGTQRRLVSRFLHHLG